MPTVNKTLQKQYSIYERCNGESFSSDSGYFEVGTSWDASNSVIIRPAEPEKTTAEGDFRPYTNYSCSGVVYRGNPVGRLTKHTSYVCDVPPGLELKNVFASGDSVLTGVSLGPFTDPGVSPGEFDGLLTQAYADVQEGLFDASTNLGELPEVLSMLAQTRRRLLDSFEQTARHAIRVEELDRYFRKRGGLGSISDLIQFISNLWLEWRYGWRPLSSSLHDLNKAIVALKLPGSNVRSGSAKTVKVISRSVSVGQTAWSPWLEQSLEITAETRRVNRASIAALLQPKDFAFTSSTLATGYNLIPLSFVLNWLVDIESWLRNATRFPRSTLMTRCTSEWVGTTVKVLGKAPSDYGDVTFTADSPISAEYESFTYRRDVVDSFQPKIVTRFDIGSADTRVYDLIALLLQRLLR